MPFRLFSLSLSLSVYLSLCFVYRGFGCLFYSSMNISFLLLAYSYGGKQTRTRAHTDIQTKYISKLYILFIYLFLVVVAVLAVYLVCCCCLRPNVVMLSTNAMLIAALAHTFSLSLPPSISLALRLSPAINTCIRLFRL